MPGVEKKILKEIMHFHHFISNMAMPLAQEPLVSDYGDLKIYPFQQLLCSNKFLST